MILNDTDSLYLTHGAFMILRQLTNPVVTAGSNRTSQIATVSFCLKILVHSITCMQRTIFIGMVRGKHQDINLQSQHSHVHIDN